MAQQSQKRLQKLLRQPDYAAFVEELQKRVRAHPEFMDEHGEQVVDMTLDNLVSRGHQEEAIADLTRGEILEAVKASMMPKENPRRKRSI